MSKISYSTKIGIIAVIASIALIVVILGCIAAARFLTAYNSNASGEVLFTNAKVAAKKECEKSNKENQDGCTLLMLSDVHKIMLGNDLNGQIYVFKDGLPKDQGYVYEVWIANDGWVHDVTRVNSPAD